MNMQIACKKEYMLMCGVYAITNKSTGSMYIGSTKNLGGRFSSHASSLGLGKHYSKKMQRDCNNFGVDSFLFKPLIICEEKDRLMYEQAAIDAFKPEYNTSPTAGSQLGLKHKEESIRKMAASTHGYLAPFLGRKHTDESRMKVSKSRREFDEDLVMRVIRLIDSGVSQREIARSEGISQSSVSNINVGLRYKDVVGNRKPNSNGRWNIHTEATKAKASERNKKLSKDQVLEIRAKLANKEPMAFIAKEFGVSRPTIQRISLGKMYTEYQ